MSEEYIEDVAASPDDDVDSRVAAPIDEGPSFDGETQDTEPVNWEARATEAEAQLETSQKRQSDTFRRYQEQNRQLGWYEGMLARDAEEAQPPSFAEQMANTPPPTIEDPDTLLTDGKVLEGYMREREEYLYNTFRAQAEPFFAATQAYDGVMRTVMKQEQRRAYVDADQMLQGEEDGYKAGDLKKNWHLVDQALKQSPKHHEYRMDPRALVTTYAVVMRGQRAGQPKPVKNPSRLPASAEPSNPRRAGDGNLPPIPRMFREAMRKLNRDPNKAWKRHNETTRGNR